MGANSFHRQRDNAAADGFELGGAQLVALAGALGELVEIGVLQRVLELGPRGTAADGDVLHDLDDPINDEPGLIILRGSLAPDGSIVKVAGVGKVKRDYLTLQMGRIPKIGQVYSEFKHFIQSRRPQSLRPIVADLNQHSRHFAHLALADDPEALANAARGRNAAKFLQVNFAVLRLLAFLSNPSSGKSPQMHARATDQRPLPYKIGGDNRHVCTRKCLPEFLDRDQAVR